MRNETVFPSKASELLRAKVDVIGLQEMSWKVQVIPAGLRHYLKGKSTPSLRTAIRLEDVLGIAHRDWFVPSASRPKDVRKALLKKVRQKIADDAAKKSTSKAEATS